MDSLPVDVWQCILENYLTSSELGRFGGASKEARALTENAAFTGLQRIEQLTELTDDASTSSHLLYLAETVDARKLWQNVQRQIDRSQTVVWVNAVNSLSYAYQHGNSSRDARYFIENYMRSIIVVIFLEQRPHLLTESYRICVRESLEKAVMIISADLRFQYNRKRECQVLDVLADIFDQRKTYYRGWRAHVGLPGVRLNMIEKFKHESGFVHLSNYLSSRIEFEQFPPLGLLHRILSAVERAGFVDNDVRQVAFAVTDFLGQASEDYIAEQPPMLLTLLLYCLLRIIDYNGGTKASIEKFHEFWRSFSLKLLSAQAPRLNEFGWSNISRLIRVSGDHRPPPTSVVVSGAGSSFVNGTYVFSGATPQQEHVPAKDETIFKRKIPEGFGALSGKTISLARCSLYSKRRRWFISEADDERPGTDKDYDYYMNPGPSRTGDNATREPPPIGWVPLKGSNPPPTLEANGLVSSNSERDTLEFKLAKWAAENDVLNLVFREPMTEKIVERSTPLFKFLATMSSHSEPVDPEFMMAAKPIESTALTTVLTKPFVTTSHIARVWESCLKAKDRKLSDQLIKLLVSILPSLPNSLAVTLLEKIEFSVGNDKAVVERFCMALFSAGGVPATLSQEAKAKLHQLLCYHVVPISKCL